MISVSQAVQSLNAAGAATTSVQLSRTALIAAALPSTPSAIVSLGNASDEEPLYTASGLLASTLTDQASSPAPGGNTTVEPASQTGPPSIVTATATAPAETSTTVAPAVPTVPAVAENAGTTATTATTVIPLAVNALANPAARALADFTTNPVHGNLATAINVNAAIYRAKPLSSASLVSAIDLPGPVTSLNAINVDITDLGQQSAGNQGRKEGRVGG